MRLYGRIYNQDGSYIWVEVSTQSDGSDGYVYTTNLVQCLKLVLGESPFYANYGIPAQVSVIQQIFPDYYVTQTQQQFSQFFTSLIISKVNNMDSVNPMPIYNIAATLPDGTKFITEIAV